MAPFAFQTIFSRPRLLKTKIFIYFKKPETLLSIILKNQAEVIIGEAVVAIGGCTDPPLNAALEIIARSNLTKFQDHPRSHDGINLLLCFCFLIKKEFFQGQKIFFHKNFFGSLANF